MTSPFRIPPLLLPLCFFITGIAVAESFALFLPPYLFLLSIFLPALSLFVRSRNLFMVSLYLTLFIAGNLLIQHSLEKNPEMTHFLESNIDRPLLLEGVIVKRPEARESGYRIVIRPEEITPVDMPGNKTKITGLLLLRIGTGGENFASGDRIRFKGKLSQPRNLGTLGEFNIERFYKLKGVVATSFVKSAADVRVVGKCADSGFQRHFDVTAAKVGRFITSHLPGAEGGVMKALLIGDMSDIPQQLKDQYSRTGVNHILSISGFHIGIIALALIQIWFAISRLFPALLLYLNFRRCALLLSIPFIIYYMFLAGAAPATARSVIMLCLLIIGLMLERESDPINSLSLAAFILLLIDPAILYNVSFQFSFLALWGLTVITPLLTKPFKSKITGWKYNLILFAAASTAAVAVTLLPAAYYFQQSSLTGIISNFFIVPLLGYGAVVTGFAALPLIWLFPVAAGYLIAIAGFMISASNSIIAMLARIPILPTFIPTEVDLVIFLFAMLFITVSRNSKIKAATLAIIPFFMILLHQIPLQENDFTLKIDFLSVGQGESTLITFSDGRRMLIDGGGTYRESGWNVGRQLLLPALNKMGVKRVDYLVLTHSHPDHLQGVKAVADALPIGEFWESGLNSGDEYLSLKEALNIHRIPVKVMTGNSSPIEISGIAVKCLYPLNRGISASDMNETSLVIRLDSGSFSALFTGDIGFEAESRLLESRQNLQVTLLKVPHHGSRHSTGPYFLDAVAPEIAMISAGYNNSFGLPAPETIEQLSAKNIMLYRTDLDGTITVELPKQGGKPVISTFKNAIKRQIN